MKNKYTPFLLSAKGKAIILIGTTGLLAAGIYGVTQVRIDYIARARVCPIVTLRRMISVTRPR